MVCVGYGKVQCNRMLNAIENNNITKLESILKFANPNTVPGLQIEKFFESRSRRTPLGKACEVGHFKMVELLIENGADVNYVPLNAYTSPLCFAVSSDSAENLKIVELLLENGADVNFDEYSPWQPVRWLMHTHSLPPNGIDILKMMMEAGTNTENDSILGDACYWKHEEAIRYLVEECGYDASESWFLRMYCTGVEKYSLETFEYFLDKGAHPYEKDEDGESAIGRLKEKSPEWAEKLIELAAKYGFEE